MNFKGAQQPFFNLPSTAFCCRDCRFVDGGPLRALNTGSRELLLPTFFVLLLPIARFVQVRIRAI